MSQYTSQKDIENANLRRRLSELSEECFMLRASAAISEAEAKYNAEIEMKKLQSEVAFMTQEMNMMRKNMKRSEAVVVNTNLSSQPSGHQNSQSLNQHSQPSSSSNAHALSVPNLSFSSYKSGTNSVLNTMSHSLVESPSLSLSPRPPKLAPAHASQSVASPNLLAAGGAAPSPNSLAAPNRNPAVCGVAIPPVARDSTKFSFAMQLYPLLEPLEEQINKYIGCYTQLRSVNSSAENSSLCLNGVANDCWDEFLSLWSHISSTMVKSVVASTCNKVELDLDGFVGSICGALEKLCKIIYWLTSIVVRDSDDLVAVLLPLLGILSLVMQYNHSVMTVSLNSYSRELLHQTIMKLLSSNLVVLKCLQCLHGSDQVVADLKPKHAIVDGAAGDKEVGDKEVFPHIPLWFAFSELLLTSYKCYDQFNRFHQFRQYSQVGYKSRVIEAKSKLDTLWFELLHVPAKLTHSVGSTNHGTLKEESFLLFVLLEFQGKLGETPGVDAVCSKLMFIIDAITLKLVPQELMTYSGESSVSGSHTGAERSYALSVLSSRLTRQCIDNSAKCTPVRYCFEPLPYILEDCIITTFCIDVDVCINGKDSMVGMTTTAAQLSVHKVEHCLQLLRFVLNALTRYPCMGAAALVLGIESEISSSSEENVQGSEDNNRNVDSSNSHTNDAYATPVPTSDGKRRLSVKGKTTPGSGGRKRSNSNITSSKRLTESSNCSKTLVDPDADDALVDGVVVRKKRKYSHSEESNSVSNSAMSIDMGHADKMFSLLIVLWRFLSDITTTTIGRFGESPVLTGKSSINNSVWIMRLLKALYRTVGILLDKLVCIAENEFYVLLYPAPIESDRDVNQLRYLPSVSTMLHSVISKIASQGRVSNSGSASTIDGANAIHIEDIPNIIAFFDTK